MSPIIFVVADDRRIGDNNTIVLCCSVWGKSTNLATAIFEPRLYYSAAAKTINESDFYNTKPCLSIENSNAVMDTIWIGFSIFMDPTLSDIDWWSYSLEKFSANSFTTRKKTAAFNLFFCSTSRRALYRVKKTLSTFVFMHVISISQIMMAKKKFWKLRILKNCIKWN